MKLKTFITSLIFVGIPETAMAGNAIVIDGDTLEIAGQKHRLHGIDAPEAGQKCSRIGGGTWKCGDAATSTLVNLVADKNVSCDNRGTDDFERIISVCKIGDIELNKTMVELGYAWAFRKFSTDYVPSEDLARNQRIGIWQSTTQTAEEFRSERWNIGLQTAPAGCPIKGNISKNGRIYHAPWSPWYNRTKINENKGERWFCSEAEALAAGWRAPIWGK